jgi:hypothetical protein
MNFTNETKKTVVSAENLSFSTNITNGECSYQRMTSAQLPSIDEPLFSSEED